MSLPCNSPRDLGSLRGPIPGPTAVSTGQEPLNDPRTGCPSPDFALGLFCPARRTWAGCFGCP